MKDKTRNIRIILICLALAAATLTSYWPVKDHEFVNFDDYDYVMNNTNVNTGLTGANIKWAFMKGHASNWHPMTWISHMVDCSLFGLDPGPHHVTNLVLHIINTLLLFFILSVMTKRLWPSVFVAALFALHPLHVESVAWVSERKDVLSTFFAFLTIAAYYSYTKKGGAGRYILVIFIFALALMSKPMVVTLPFVLLLVDYWPLERFDLVKSYKPKTHSKQRSLTWLIAEKIPFFALVIISSVVTFIVQKAGGAMSSRMQFPFLTRLANASIAYLVYIKQMVWPKGLACLYPHARTDVSIPLAVICGLSLIAVSALVFIYRQKFRYLFTGWFWYVGMLVPVVGLVQIGDQAYADRYTYMPIIGLFIIIAWGACDLLKKPAYRRAILLPAAVVIISVLAVLTYIQQGYWRDNIKLFERAIDATKDNYVAHFCIADPLRESNRIEDAIYHNRKCLEIEPDYTKAHNSLGQNLMLTGDVDGAIKEFTKAVELSPGILAPRLNLGLALQMQGNYKQAIEQFTIGLQMYDLVRVREHLADVLFKAGRLDEALVQYNHILTIKPNDIIALYHAGLISGQAGKFSEAEKYLVKALELDPGMLASRINLGIALKKQGNYKQAIEQFTIALQMDDMVNVREHLADVLFKAGRLNEALAQYNHILTVESNNIKALYHAGLIFAQAGKFSEAEKYLVKALELDPNYIVAKNTYSGVLIQQGRYEEAVKQCRAILQVDPAVIEAHSNCGFALMKLGRDEEAAQEYKITLEAKPDSFSVHNDLAVVLYGLGRIDEAIEHLRIAIKIAPDFADAQNNLKMILQERSKKTPANNSSGKQF
ncbi:MAG: tetratricopeptide repeat protein [Planctomycetes bacterium]|nr:tetratricopeptide repeat protein [Planctomycetota bacterium]